MKVKITDLMALYEDEHCSLSPTEEQHERAGDPSARMEITEEVNEVKQSKHRFGWKEGLSLAAALALVVLGGFGVKRLIDRGAAPVVPGASSELAPIESRNSDWEATEGEEKEAISRFLTVFVNQHIKNVPMEDLNNPGSLIHFAFVWRRNNDCESITVREGPEGLTDTLTLEQINEVLEPLLGKTVELPENDPGIVNRTPGMDFDYSEQLGREAGSVCYRDGCFWDQPAQNDTGLFFALATLRAPDREPGRELVLFKVYYVNYERWGTIDMAAMPALSTAETEALEAEEKLILKATGEAQLERIEDGYRLLSYVTEPAAEQNNVQAIDLSEINWQLTYLAEQGIEKLETDLDEEYELAQFVHIYLKRHSDPGSDQLLYQSDETGSYETVGLGWVNLILDNMFGKTLSPIEGTDYTVLRGENYAQHESFHDGFFWWPAADGETSTRFARCNWARQKDGQVESSFMVYEADPAYMEQQRSQDITLDPGVDPEDWIWNQLIRMDDAELQTHIAAGEIIPIRIGTAELQKHEQQGWRLLSYEAEPLPPSTEPDPPEDSLARVNALLTAFAEQGITDSGLDLAGEYELAQFAHIYTKLHEREAIRYQSADGESWETLTLEQVNETLTRLLGKELSPAEGTDYSAQRGENYAQHESYHDGCFWWPAADGETHPDFAIFADNYHYTLVGHGTEELPFLLLEAIPEAWPDWESAALSELNTEDIMALIKAGKLEMLSSSGRATIRWEGAEPVMQSFQVNYANRASYVLDSLLCARQTDPDGLDSVREIQLMRDGSFRYRERRQDSDYSYWCKGSWRMLRNGMRLDYSETDALWSDTQAAARYAVYAIDYDESGFHMTLVEGAGLGRDQIGWYVCYNAAPDVEPDDSDEDLHVDVTTSD